MRASRAVALLVALITIVPVALGTWSGPTAVPVRRLLDNVGKFVAENPADARGHATLARIHSLAFTLDSRIVAAAERGKLPRVASTYWQQSFSYQDRRRTSTLEWGLDAFDRAPPSPEEQLEHLREAIRSYRRALELDESQAEYHLGLAYVVESGAHLASHLRTTDLLVDPSTARTRAEGVHLEQLILALGDPAAADAAEVELRAALAAAVSALDGFRLDANAERQTRVARMLADCWREIAIAHYARAFELAEPADEALPELPMPWPGAHPLSGLITYEAGQAHNRLVQARGIRNEGERAMLARIEASLKHLATLPFPRTVTPIIFSLERSASLDDLLARDTAVAFDLDGDGVVEHWPWVRRDTAILVWDPERRGEITSGMQLFGSVTWWMLFADGYHALDALDDDRDGQLAGRELRGIAVWIDRNGNGRSDPQEVTPIERTSIRAIATHATGMEGVSPSCDRGVQLSDSRVLPTYDWVTLPCPRSR